MSEFVLPPIGKHEDQELDFKAQLNVKDGKTDYLELAKDMAAMANAYGGVIIIGACEDRKGVLSLYKPMTEADAVAACNEYKTAQRDRLRPAVIVLPEMIPHEDGFLVTVRVEPSMGQAIGVRFKPTIEIVPETKQPPEIFGFPVRVGDNTTWLQAEQLPMLMIPTLRRNIILLQQAQGQHAIVDFIYTNGQHGKGTSGSLVDKLDEMGNTIRCGSMVIPLDQIASVWRDAQWRILWDQRAGR